MSSKDPSNKVISLQRRRGQKSQKTSKSDNGNSGSKARVISITSGKGGVGKTSIVANLGYAFTKMGKKVLILDADLGLGNLDVLLGLAPKFNLSHVIMGEKKIEEILVERGIDVSYETIRRWVLKFGPAIAANVRSRRVQPSGT